MTGQNIVLQVMKFLGRMDRSVLVTIFGSQGEELWNLYKNRYYHNPWLWFIDALNDDMQDKITLYAIGAPFTDYEMHSCKHLSTWSTAKALRLLKELIEERGGSVELGGGVLHDFPMRNGFYQSPVLEVCIKRDSVCVVGRYSTQYIFGYIDIETPFKELAELYETIKNKSV